MVVINGNMNNKIIILCGIPCSGKSTYAKSREGYYTFDEIKMSIVSRDTIREKRFGKDYKQNFFDEESVSFMFDFQVKHYLDIGNYVILDNCHTKEKYLDEIINKYRGYQIEIKFFNCSLIKAYYRNINRWMFTGKFIPFKVIKNMYRNYNKINRNKYDKYIFY